MANTPDPCYCQQAQDYEALLIKVRNEIADGNCGCGAYCPPLVAAIDMLIQGYREAQREYMECAQNVHWAKEEDHHG